MKLLVIFLLSLSSPARLWQHCALQNKLKDFLVVLFCSTMICCYDKSREQGSHFIWFNLFLFTNQMASPVKKHSVTLKHNLRVKRFLLPCQNFTVSLNQLGKTLECLPKCFGKPDVLHGRVWGSSTSTIGSHYRWMALWAPENSPLDD